MLSGWLSTYSCVSPDRIPSPINLVKSEEFVHFAPATASIHEVVSVTAILLESIDDPRVDPFRNLRGDGVLRREGRFIVEGDWLVQRLALSRFPIQSALCGDACVERVQQYLPDNCPIYVLSKNRISEIVGFSFHRGVLACANGQPLA